jgi:hypothetical protein
MEAKLKSFLADLKTLRQGIRAESHERIARTAPRQHAEKLASRWFSDIAKDLADYSFPAELIKRYSDGATRLIKLAEHNNRRTSYLEVLDGLVRCFRDELVLPIQRGEVQPKRASPFGQFLASLPNAEESEYLQEALGCAQNGFLKAAAVMGWCAAIDRIHRKIEQTGFAKFNTVSAQMAGQTKGRYKRFNQSQSVSSLGELREVFDTTILWIIEGMNLVDPNQHTRLSGCFEMRCQCAHPGEAPITEYNLMSFFSDIQRIVLENEKFKIV